MKGTAKLITEAGRDKDQGEQGGTSGRKGDGEGLLSVHLSS